MLPGFHGPLISEFFLEQHLADSATGDGSHEAIRHDLLNWRRRTASLGPASSLRTLVEASAEPLLRALGFGELRHVEFGPDAVIATLSAGSDPVALVVTGWGQRLEPHWRFAVVHSRRRDLSWCLLFNGTHLRLVEA